MRNSVKISHEKFWENHTISLQKEKRKSSKSNKKKKDFHYNGNLSFKEK